MAVRPRFPVALAAAALLAIGMPAFLLTRTAPPPQASRADRPLALRAPDAAEAAYRRPLFAPAANQDGADQPPPADAPALAGVIGRIGTDAVALVRTPAGTRTLAVGDSVDGWRLGALSADAAYFERGGQRARIPLPGSDQ